MMQLKPYQTELLDDFEHFLDLCRVKGGPRLAFEESTREWKGVGFPYHALPATNTNPDGASVPFVCLRVPTGGGKTFLAAFAIERVVRGYLPSQYALTLWLVPTEAIREQTLRVLKERESPVAKAMRREMGEFTVLDVSEALYMQPATLDTGHVIIVATMQSFKREDTSGLTAYKENGQLMPHFRSTQDKAVIGNHSLADVIRLRRPFIVVDEAHNEGTSLALDTVSNFRPSVVLELTATPDRKHSPSNVLRSISASTLQSYDMLKLPLELAVHEDWKAVLRDALARRDQLEKDAEGEAGKTGEQIRPVLFIQAEKKHRDHETFTAEKVKEILVDEFKRSAEDVAISTGSTDELSGKQVGDPDFPRIIITVDKLREGWDCPVAYVLMTFRNSTSATAVEQVVGRILRMPNVTRKRTETLNRAYAYACSNTFADVLNSLRDGLVQSGFEKQETKELIVAKDSGQQDIFGDTQEVVIQLPEDTNGVLCEPDLSEFTASEKKKIDIVPEAGRMTVTGRVTPAFKDKLIAAFRAPEHQSAIAKDFELQSGQPDTGMPKTPSQEGVEFAVPQLLVKQGDFTSLFDGTSLIDGDWEVADFDPVLSESEFPREQEAMRRARITMGNLETIEIEPYEKLEKQLALVSDEKGWDMLSLCGWLDRNIPFVYATQDEKVAWIRRVLEELIGQRGFGIDELAYRKFRLRRAIEDKLMTGLQIVQQQSFVELIREPEQFSLEAGNYGIIFKQGRYSYDDAYAGYYRFQKHFFGVIGNLKPQGEEFECAMQIDSMEAVEYWVRNVEKKPGAFWLQTSRGRFYPDFVAKLKDGRILVVEYKGAHLAEMASQQEKGDIGKLWAARSNGCCLFVMVSEREWSMLRGVL